MIVILMTVTIIMSTADSSQWVRWISLLSSDNQWEVFLLSQYWVCKTVKNHLDSAFSELELQTI